MIRKYAGGWHALSPLIKKRHYSLLFLIIGFVQPIPEIRALLLTGLFIENLVITPFFYKLTRKDYKNYEYYEEEQ